MTASLALDPLPVETPRVLFDVSRLLRRRNQRFGTGVDRIDLAIGCDLLARFGSACDFAHASAFGPVILPQETGAALLGAISAHWRGEDAPDPGILSALTRSARLPRPAAIRDETTYVVASHSGLPMRAGALARIDPGRRMRRLAYLHDLIPIDYPEYQRPRSLRGFRQFLAEIADGPTAFVANSGDTARRIAAHADAEGWNITGIDVRTPRIAAPTPEASVPRPRIRAILESSEPFFLALGTIEPRKNHLLLLHLWRDLAEAGAAPRLVVVGRRGWENEMVVDMLERCPAVSRHVDEFGDLTDGETALLLRRARALLMPSFAEGLGIPVLEAAAVGAPMILSDLPALREIAPQDALFLNPLDGPGWRRAILAAAAGGPSMRLAPGPAWDDNAIGGASTTADPRDEPGAATRTA